MFCQRCGTQLPDNARFCYSCGSTIAGAAPAGPAGAPPPPPPPPAAAPSPPPLAPPGARSLKCPQCGAPLEPDSADMVVSCEYCGATVSLAGTGWKPLARHSILLPKVVDSAAALEIVRAQLDQGFLHKKAFEESKIVEQSLSFVPFWVLPCTATTNYQYTDVAVSVAGTAGEIAMAEMLGGRRGPSFIALPTGPAVNATRQDTLVGSYEFPVVAVKGMTSHQPKDYQFGLSERTVFDKRAVPSGAPVLNGDLGEDAAKFSAKSFVMQLQTQEAHRKHTMVSNLSCQVEVADGELLHVPIWYIVLDRKGQRTTVLIDAHAARVMQTVP